MNHTVELLLASGSILFVFFVLAGIAGFLWSEKTRNKRIEAGAEMLRQEMRTWKSRRGMGDEF